MPEWKSFSVHPGVPHRRVVGDTSSSVFIGWAVPSGPRPSAGVGEADDDETALVVVGGGVGAVTAGGAEAVRGVAPAFAYAAFALAPNSMPLK